MVDTTGKELILHHAPRTRSIRCRWLLEEMGIAYTLKQAPYRATPEETAAYRELHPLAKIPALEHGETTMFESVAIMQYILATFGPSELEVRPGETDYGRFLQWLHFGEGGMTLPVTMLLAHTALLPEEHRNAGIAAWAKSETDKHLEALEHSGIGKGSYLVADRLTAADISVGYMLYLLKIIRQFGDAPDSVRAYFRRITARDSWKIASAD
ncbi:glutathione S-transferase family protein [Maricaulis sp. MIT060901]|uniref:glutathione S-transferase family protein n=1 Tax=Maricaulis sp. MIT060901 TaxID=3096993 RepID=UPI00399A8205